MPNNSKHLLPMNSMLFNSQFSLRAPFLRRDHNPTLVNIREAADTSITALPSPPATTKKPSAWRRAIARVKKVVRFGRARKMIIGEPMDFQHRETGGPRSLKTGSRAIAGARERRMKRMKREKRGE